MEQLITDVFTKTIHTILESRSPNLSCDKGFNLSLSDSNPGPFVVDVILCPTKTVKEKIVERWFVQCESEGNIHAKKDSCSCSQFNVTLRKVSKKIIVLLRSLYCTVRLLPAYKLFRDVTASSSKVYPICLSYRISSFVEPFSREEDSEMRQLDFGSVDIFCTKFSLSVSYLKTLKDVNEEPLDCMSSELVMDYVGSPLADPHRLFPSCQCLHQNVASSCSITCVSSGGHSKQCKGMRTSLPIATSYSSSSTSAPVSIPLCRHKTSDVGPKNTSLLDVIGAQVSVTSAHLPKKQLQSENETTMLLSKTAFTGKDSPGHITTFRTPRSSTVRQSRTSRRLFFMDEFDDSDFICHFAEDVETKNTCRAKSDNGDDHAGENSTSRRSPDAAVGALVWMLKTAPPLRLDNSNMQKSMHVSKGQVSSQKSKLEKMSSNRENDAVKVGSTLCSDITTSEPCKLSTAAEAFKELRTYKGIRELIVKQSGSQLRDVEHSAKSNTRDSSEIQ